MRSALQPMNMHGCARVHLKRRDEWPLELCDTQLEMVTQDPQRQFLPAWESVQWSAENAPFRYILTISDSNDELYVLEKFQVPE